MPKAKTKKTKPQTRKKTTKSGGKKSHSHKKNTRATIRTIARTGLAVVVFTIIFALSLDHYLESQPKPTPITPSNNSNPAPQTTNTPPDKPHTQLTIITADSDDFDSNILPNLENLLNLNLKTNYLSPQNTRSQEIITALQIKRLPAAFLPPNFHSSPHFESVSTYFEQTDFGYQINLNAFGQPDYHYLGEIPDPPSTLPRLGKKGALLTAYLFGEYTSAEKNIIQTVLPALEPYFFDGTLKLYFVPNLTANATDKYRTAMATKCIQRYSDEFFWQYLDLYYSAEPISHTYAHLLDLTRQIELSQYFFGRCMAGNYYASDLSAEEKFAQEFQFQSPTLLIENHTLSGKNIQTSNIRQIITELKQSKSNTLSEINFTKFEPSTSPENLLPEPNWGNPQAPLQISIYSGFDCQSCKALHASLKEARQEFQNQIKLTFRHYPQNKKGQTQALAAECATEQDGFWPYADLLFANAKPSLNEVEFSNLADQVGLNRRAFTLCLKESRYLPEVQKDLQEAKKIGLPAPIICFNANCESGALPTSTLREKIQTHLAQ